jgi:hypothetical protein
MVKSGSVTTKKKSPAVKGGSTKSGAVVAKTLSAKKTKAKQVARPVTRKNSRAKAEKTTKLVVRFDVGFNNKIYIRGGLPSLSWDSGTLLKNVAPDTWVWECDQAFEGAEFKVLINDRFFEGGVNHSLLCGETREYTPNFPPTW